MIDDFISIAEVLNERFSSELGLDFEVMSLRKGILKIKASRDFCYYHQCEIEFSDVQYYSGPMEWKSNPPDGLMEVHEKRDAVELINKYELSPPCHSIALMTDNSTNVIIAAESIQINFDTVFYYMRENLGPNERIDDDIARLAQEGRLHNG